MRLEERGFYSPSFRIPWEQLSSSLSITLNFLLGFRVSPSRFTDLWIREGSRTGFVTSLLLSTAVFEIIKPLSLGQPVNSLPLFTFVERDPLYPAKCIFK